MPGVKSCTTNLLMIYLDVRVQSPSSCFVPEIFLEMKHLKRNLSERGDPAGSPGGDGEKPCVMVSVWSEFLFAPSWEVLINGGPNPCLSFPLCYIVEQRHMFMGTFECLSLHGGEQCRRGKDIKGDGSAWDDKTTVRGWCHKNNHNLRGKNKIWIFFCNGFTLNQGNCTFAILRRNTTMKKEYVSVRSVGLNGIARERLSYHPIWRISCLTSRAPPGNPLLQSAKHWESIGSNQLGQLRVWKDRLWSMCKKERYSPSVRIRGHHHALGWRFSSCEESYSVVEAVKCFW